MKFSLVKFIRQLTQSLLIFLGATSTLLVLLFFGSEYYRSLYESRLIPPPQVFRLVDFLHWMPSATITYKIEIGSATYYQIQGEWGAILPSGPSVYSFDKWGNLVDYTIDSGDRNNPRLLFGTWATSTRIELEVMKSEILGIPKR